VSDSGQPPARIEYAGWDALCRTAAMVRAQPEQRGGRRRRPARRAVAAGALLGAAVFAGAHLQGQPARADASADSDLFALTNQDRTSNGVAALADNSTLSAIGEAAPYSGCSGAGTIDGRAQDMINRNYFAHQIPPCNQYVWSMMSAFGVHFESAGENIGWESGYGSSSASQVNTQFMGSPDHRANILNPSYTALGIGSAYAASGWTGSPGGPYSGVWMFAEEFAQLPSSAPPPARSSAPSSTSPARTSPASAAATPAPTPAPTPTPTPAPTPTPLPVPGPPLPAYESSGQGLISDTIEATLEAFLFS
jgi:uncharacterized protein YkwD